jgi:transposase-like protein
MPRKYPEEFRRRAIALVRSGQRVVKTAADLGIASACLHGWVKQDRIFRGEIAGVSSVQFRGLRKANRRLRNLKGEVEILRRADAMLGRPAQQPKDSPGDRRTGRLWVRCEARRPVLGVSRQGYYRDRSRSMSPTMMRREWINAVMTQPIPTPAGPAIPRACWPS